MNRYNSIMLDTQKVDATLNGEAERGGDRPAESRKADSGGVEPEHLRTSEYGGRKSGLDPIRYGDWEMNGRCIDF